MGVLECPHGVWRIGGEICERCNKADAEKRFAALRREREAVARAAQQAVERGEAFKCSSMDGRMAITVVSAGKSKVEIELDQCGVVADAVLDRKTATKLARALVKLLDPRLAKKPVKKRKAKR